MKDTCISASVTRKGRELLAAAKREIHRLFPGCRVVVCHTRLPVLQNNKR